MKTARNQRDGAEVFMAAKKVTTDENDFDAWDRLAAPDHA